eukprot:GEZU01039315.1.p3 GENE.GEZU01039315.1~~GEZU01039315.1.p3  ORF type:complete len:102 (+),score=38.28 GEZU01039315.1:64-369(+)
MNSCAIRGFVVFFGNASGPVPPIDPLLLSSKGSLSITRPTLAHFVASSEELHSRATDLFNWLRSGQLKLNIYKVFDLAEASKAHDEIQSGATTGKIILKVD